MKSFDPSKIASDILDPIIHVKGYGQLRLSALKLKVIEYGNSIAQAASNDNWTAAEHFAFRNGVLKAMLEAASEYEASLEKSAN